MYQSTSLCLSVYPSIWIYKCALKSSSSLRENTIKSMPPSYLTPILPPNGKWTLVSLERSSEQYTHAYIYIAMLFLLKHISKDLSEWVHRTLFNNCIKLDCVIFHNFLSQFPISSHLVGFQAKSTTTFLCQCFGTHVDVCNFQKWTLRVKEFAHLNLTVLAKSLSKEAAITILLSME